MSSIRTPRRTPHRCPPRGFLPLALALALALASGTPATGAIEPGLQLRPLPPSATTGTRTSFTRMDSANTGVTFTNQLSPEQISRNRLSEDGSGVAAGDVDGDGWCDLYFCGLESPNALFRNRGDWTFEEITARAGVACGDQLSTGAAFADLDGDGDLDLLVNALGRGTRCFINDGSGRFTEPPNPGLDRSAGSRSLALADIDDDGDLDLYVANYRATTVRDAPIPVKVRRVGTRWEVPPEHRGRFIAEPSAEGTVALLERGEPDGFYLNNGQGQFTALVWNSGNFFDEDGKPLTESPHDWSLSATFRDLNEDGRPDLYVCNDFFTPDRIWINQGGGRFRAMPLQALRKTPYASMAVDFADLDRDGHDEIFATEMLSRDHRRRQVQHSLLEMPPLPAWGWGWPPGPGTERLQVMRNTLSLNRGDGTYAEIAAFSGVHASEWTWGVAFCDVDLDGFEDLLIANGHGRDVAHSDALAEVDARPKGVRPAERLKTHHLFPPLPLPNLAFRNRGDLTFEEVGREWNFNVVGAANGMALADLDNDGDQDVLLNHLNGPAVLLRNDASAPRLAIRLRGDRGLTHGTGAKIVVLGGPVPQSQEVLCGGRYLSCDDPIRVFATGTATHLTVEIRWPGGHRSRFDRVPPNCIAIVDATQMARSPKAPSAPQPSDPRPSFEDRSDALGLVHHDDPFDDFALQPLLPRRLSHLGPGLAWCDLNGDERDDLIVGTGRGGRLRVRINNGQGGFAPVEAPAWSEPATDDLTGVVAWAPEPGRVSVLVGRANYESQSTTAPSVVGYDVFFGNVEAVPVAPGSTNSPGPLAVADIDADGDLDLFVGGRLSPGRYPAPASSRLFRNDKGRFVPDTPNNQVLADLGLVTSAVWTDLDNDGRPELALATDWGPLHLFRLRNGRLVAEDAVLVWTDTSNADAKRPSRLGDMTGWWNGITAGDLDGDGRLDLVAANWGLNCRPAEFLAAGWQVVHGDFDGNGVWDLLESFRDGRSADWFPWRDYRTLGKALPSLTGRYRTYGEFAQATLPELLSSARPPLHHRTVNTLESMALLNRGGHFEARPLPVAAQLSPAFAVCVSDYNGDGREDLFLSQNFFGTTLETGRFDAGRALWLQGDGTGRFKAIPGHESGIAVYGEQRGAAIADYDGDGRVDVAVSQNAAGIRLFRNVRAKPGLRVELVGPAGNASGIGSVLRLGTADGWGPARELHGGSGYWSQDSPVQVLALDRPGPYRLQVRWPGGVTSTADVPSGTRFIRIHANGHIDRSP